MTSTNIKYSFPNRTVLISAGSKGIGRGIAKSFFTAGAQVAICGRDSSSLMEAEKFITSGNDKTRFFSLAGDIADGKFLSTFVQATEKHFSKSIDILINNNGGPPAGDTLQFSDEQWLQAIHINLLSTIRLSKLVAPKMIEKKWGRIINLTSTTGREPEQGMVLSNVTRAGVSSYARTLSKDLGPHGITVNTILTGGCLTDRLYNLIEKDIAGTGESLADAVTRISKTIPVQFIPEPDEFSKSVLFLASEEARFITGTSIAIDGGVTRALF